MGAIPPLPQYVFIAWCLVKHRAFIFTSFQDLLVLLPHNLLTSAMLLLLVVGNYKVRDYGGLEWHNINVKFHENRSVDLDPEKGHSHIA
jgi:hypothetical protein